MRTIRKSMLKRKTYKGGALYRKTKLADRMHPEFQHNMPQTVLPPYENNLHNDEEPINTKVSADTSNLDIIHNDNYDNMTYTINNDILQDYFEINMKKGQLILGYNVDTLLYNNVKAYYQVGGIIKGLKRYFTGEEFYIEKYQALDDGMIRFERDTHNIFMSASRASASIISVELNPTVRKILIADSLSLLATTGNINYNIMYRIRLVRASVFLTELSLSEKYNKGICWLFLNHSEKINIPEGQEYVFQPHLINMVILNKQANYRVKTVVFNLFKKRVDRRVVAITGPATCYISSSSINPDRIYHKYQIPYSLSSTMSQNGLNGNVTPTGHTGNLSPMGIEGNMMQ
jgi:uncharacterized protein (AIM24 family)